MEIDSFLKSAVVIDNVNNHLNLGKRLYESRIQWIRKKTFRLPLHVPNQLISVSADPNIMWLSLTLTINSNNTWAMILPPKKEAFISLDTPFPTEL